MTRSAELEAYYRHLFRAQVSTPSAIRLEDTLYWREYRSDLVNAAERAISAGATPPLEFMGMGAQGVVLCDRRYAYKVSRGKYVRSLADEAEWLSTASQIRKVRPHIATFVDWNPRLGVLTRQCVRGQPGHFGQAQKVLAVFRTVEPYMLAAGWGMPEHKTDSIVFTKAGKGKIVDAGFVARISNRLLMYVESILEGRRARDPDDYAHDLSTLAFEIRREMIANPDAVRKGKREPLLDQRRAKNILDRLYQLGART